MAVDVAMGMPVMHRWRRGHIVATVWQMGSMVQAHLVAMVMRKMALCRFQQRGLYVSHKLSHGCLLKRRTLGTGT